MNIKSAEESLTDWAKNSIEFNLIFYKFPNLLSGLINVCTEYASQFQPEQKQVVSDEEIEVMAKKEYPYIPNHLEYNTQMLLNRQTYIKGAKAILSALNTNSAEQSDDEWVKKLEKMPDLNSAEKEDIGLKDGKGKNIYEGDMYFSEDGQADGSDIRIFFVVKWIKEWAMYSLLSMSELPDYEDNGIDALDDTMRNTFVLDEKEFKNLHFKGNVFENPKLLEIVNEQI